MINLYFTMRLPPYPPERRRWATDVETRTIDDPLPAPRSRSVRPLSLWPTRCSLTAVAVYRYALVCTRARVCACPQVTRMVVCNTSRYDYNYYYYYYYSRRTRLSRYNYYLRVTVRNSKPTRVTHISRSADVVKCETATPPHRCRNDGDVKKTHAFN